jgi:hypothetical protein
MRGRKRSAVSLLQLPKDLCVSVLLHLLPQDLLSFALACKKARDVLKGSDRLRRRMCHFTRTSTGKEELLIYLVNDEHPPGWSGECLAGVYQDGGCDVLRYEYDPTVEDYYIKHYFLKDGASLRLRMEQRMYEMTAGRKEFPDGWVFVAQLGRDGSVEELRSCVARVAGFLDVQPDALATYRPAMVVGLHLRDTMDADESELVAFAKEQGAVFHSTRRVSALGARSDAFREVTTWFDNLVHQILSGRSRLEEKSEQEVDDRRGCRMF